MSSVRQAFALSFLTRYISLITQFLASVAIARLLTPEEVGVFSIAAALVFLAQTMRDFGTAQYIVQEKELTRDRIRAAFSVTLLLGWTIGVSLILVASAAGRFYEHEGVEHVILLVSVSFSPSIRHSHFCLLRATAEFHAHNRGRSRYSRSAIFDVGWVCLVRTELHEHGVGLTRRNCHNDPHHVRGASA